MASKGKAGNNFTDEWFRERGYTRNEQGGYDPPPFKNPFTTPKSGPTFDGTGSILISKPTIHSEHDVIEALTKLENKVWYVGNATEVSIQNILMVFDVVPIGKPRMTRSDKWKTDPNHEDPKKRQRKPVTQYFKFKDIVRDQALRNGFKMPENGFHVVFYIPMPHSWSTKKKNQMNGAPHQQKIDLDNACKALFDALLDEDKLVWDFRATKYWAHSGKILIYQI